MTVETQSKSPDARRRYPPGPRNSTPLGHLGFFTGDRIGNLMALARTGDSITHFRLAGQHVYLLNDAEYIKQVLVTNERDFVKSRASRTLKRVLGEGLLTSEGEFHLKQRRLVQPAFHRTRMAGYGNVMVGYAARLRDRWSAGAVVDMHHDMVELTFAIAGKTLFNADVGDQADEIGEALTEMMRFFPRSLSLLGPVLDRLPLRSNRQVEEARQRLGRVVDGIIAERRKSPTDEGDLLGILLSAKDEDGRGMTDRQVRDEAMTLLLAGHETTANLLSWTWYLLAQHPEVEAQLHSELDRVLSGRNPGLEDVPELMYTNMVLTESMRLYPPAYVLSRVATRDVAIGGYPIAARSIVLMSQYVTHRNPRYYRDPERFDPGRWTPEARADLPRFAYFPFGGGTRVCIGEPFAWLEGSLVLATLAQRWRPRLATGYPPVEREPLVTLRPKNGIWMKLEDRVQAS